MIHLDWDFLSAIATVLVAMGMGLSFVGIIAILCALFARYSSNE